MKSAAPYWVLSGIAVLFTGVVAAHDIFYFFNYCYHTYDLGIYMEAVRDFRFSHPNPFLYTFGYGFLNNHWNPALALATLPAMIFGLPYGAFFTEIAAHLLTALVPLWLVRKGYLKPWTAVLLATFLLINENILESTLAIPIHCEVWANLPLLFFFAFLAVRSERIEEIGILPISIFIFVISFFSEQFSLSGLGLALAYLFLSPKKAPALVPLALAVFLVWFTVSGRELFIGPILHHTKRVSFSPVGVFRMYNWDLAQFKTVGKFLLAPLILSLAVYKSKKSPFVIDKPFFYKIVFALGIFGPLLLGRFLSNSFGHQYSAVLPVFVVALAIIFLKDLSVSPRVFGACVCLFFILAFSKFERVFNVLTQRSLPNCVKTDDVKATNGGRIQNLDAQFSNFKKVSDADARKFQIFAGGNLVPNFVAWLPRFRTVTLDITQAHESLSQFGWIITEYGFCGDSWPWSKDEVNAFVDEISKRKDFEVIQKTGCLFMAKRPLL